MRSERTAEPAGRPGLTGWYPPTGVVLREGVTGVLRRWLSRFATVVLGMVVLRGVPRLVSTVTSVRGWAAMRCNSLRTSTPLA